MALGLTLRELSLTSELQLLASVLLQIAMSTFCHQSGQTSPTLIPRLDPPDGLGKSSYSFIKGGGLNQGAWTPPVPFPSNISCPCLCVLGCVCAKPCNRGSLSVVLERPIQFSWKGPKPKVLSLWNQQGFLERTVWDFFRETDFGGMVSADALI